MFNQSPRLMANNVLIVWNWSRSCFDLLGSYETKGEAKAAAKAFDRVKADRDWETEVVSRAEFERLEALA